MSAMVVYGDDLYLAEGFPSGNLGKYDGKTWSIVVKGHEPFGTQNQGFLSLAVLQDQTLCQHASQAEQGNPGMGVSRFRTSLPPSTQSL